MFQPLSKENPIEILDKKIDVSDLVDVLERNPYLWGQHQMRTVKGGPHRDVSDIWVRCLPWEIMQQNPVAFNHPHKSRWYPAADFKPLKDAAIEVFEYMEGDSMGGVLITKIPPGKSVLPHIDHGWHARAHCKVALQIKAHEMQRFCFETKQISTMPGDVFWFDNSFVHWVENPSPVERVTMIVCIQRRH